MKSLNIKEIEAIIPHRHPFLLVEPLRITNRENMRLVTKV